MMVKSQIWVVRLDNLNTKNPKRDKKIVRAKTEQDAIRTAKANSIVFRTSRVYAEAYIADPVIDLGMKKTPEEALRKFNLGL